MSAKTRVGVQVIHPSTMFVVEFIHPAAMFVYIWILIGILIRSIVYQLGNLHINQGRMNIN